MRSCWYLVTDWVCILETRVLGFGNAVEKNGFIRKLPRNNQICKKGRKTLFNLHKTHFSADFGYTRTVTIYIFLSFLKAQLKFKLYLGGDDNDRS